MPMRHAQHYGVRPFILRWTRRFYGALSWLLFLCFCYWLAGIVLWP